MEEWPRLFFAALAARGASSAGGIWGMGRGPFGVSAETVSGMARPVCGMGGYRRVFQRPLEAVCRFSGNRLRERKRLPAAWD